MQGSKPAGYNEFDGRSEQALAGPELYAQLRWRGVWMWLRVRRQTRLALAQLSAEQLRDIGLSREQAQHEAGLPFWR